VHVLEEFEKKTLLPTKEKKRERKKKGKQTLKERQCFT
jgi:hypothetical protein